MKTVDSNFTDERDKQHPARAKHRITLQTYDMSGTAITDEKYDLTNDLISLPEIKSELESQLNANKASSLSLEFYDNEDTIWDYFASGNRRWGIKIEQTYNTPNITASDNIACGDHPYTCCFAPNGKTLFVGHWGTNYPIYKFDIAVNGSLTLNTSANTSEEIWRMKCTDDYLYVTKEGGVFAIYDHDLTLQDSIDCTVDTKDLMYLAVTSDENYAWVITNPEASDDNVYLITMTDKTDISVTTEITGFTASVLVVNGDYLYVGDWDNSTLKTYDISTPTSPSLVDTLTLDISYPRTSCFDEDRAIIYMATGGAAPNTNIAVIDISDADAPALASTDTSHYGNLQRSDLFLFASYPGYPSAGKTTMYVMDTINHYKLSEYNSVLLSTASFNSFDYNGDNVIAVLDGDNDKVYTYTIWQNWVTLFEGIIDYQSLRKIGRNRTYFTAYTGEKELETYNAEMVYDTTTTDYLRNITGVIVSGLTGGTTGAKKLEYTYKTLNEGGSNIDEFSLKYEGGEEFLFREAGTYDLTGSSGQIISLTISDTDGLPRKNAEDTMVIGDAEDYTSIGYWYESEEISTIVGYLWDKSDFTISTQNTDIDTTASALSDTWQFYYSDKVAVGAGDNHSCVEDNPPDSDTILWACGINVYSVSYDSDTYQFTGTELLDITDTFANATRVDKILRLPNGNALVVCVSGTKKAGYEGYDSWAKLEGIMEIENDGTIIHSWDRGFLDGSVPRTLLAGTSVELMNYTKGTGEVVDRNAFYYVGAYIYSGSLVVDVCLVDIDYNPNSLYEENIEFVSLSSTPWVAPNVVYHRYWNDTTPDGSDYHCWYLYADNSVDGEGNPIGYIKKKYTGGSVEEALTYCTAGTINSIRVIRANDSRRRFYLITSKMASEKQYIFKCIAAGPGSTSINTEPVDYILDYAAYLPNAYRATAFEIDGADNAQNLVMLNWGTGIDNPTITDIANGFMGHTYSPHSVCYLGADETYIGSAEMGALPISRFFIASNLSILIVPVADFSDLNVRQALNMMAEAYVCLWNRPELDTANFISRGNYTDEYTLEKGLYLPQYQISKQPPYLAVEAKNTYYEGRVYLARHPDDYMGEKGDMLQIDNRFITPVNKNAIALVYYNFYNTIRRIFEVESYYLIELELFDKVVMTLYDIDGNEDETVNTLLVEKSFNNATKGVKLRLIELDVSAFSGTIGGLWLRRKVC